MQSMPRKIPRLYIIIMISILGMYVYGLIAQVSYEPLGNDTKLISDYCNNSCINASYDRGIIRTSESLWDDNITVSCNCIRDYNKRLWEASYEPDN